MIASRIYIKYGKIDTSIKTTVIKKVNLNTTFSIPLLVNEDELVEGLPKPVPRDCINIRTIRAIAEII